MTATDDRTALLDAVLADPQSDLPRLILADHLDDAGEPDQAEFIRVQCEIGRLQECYGWGRYHTPDPFFRDVEDDRFARLLRRERALFRATQTDADGLRRCLPGSAIDRREVIPGPDLVAVVHRGFVDEVRCTLGKLFGGQCGRCGGRGDEYVGIANTTDCPACSGTGRTPGIAADLFRRHPVMRVVLTDVAGPTWVNDRQPWPVGMWGWHLGGDDPDGLQPELWRLLAGGHVHHDRRTWVGWRWWKSEQDCRNALSAAVVRLGRTLARLDPLPEAAR